MKSDVPIRVLLVEDEAGDAQLVSIDLKNAQSGKFSIVWVGTLTEAEQQLQNANFDVVLLDLSLPDSNGLATLCAVRSMVAELPIVVLTGHGDTEFALQALEAGATDYIVKGNFGYDGLARVIRYALFRAEMEAKNNLLVAALEAAANGVVITDKNAEIKWVNQSFTRLTGYSFEEAVGKTPKQLVNSQLQSREFYQSMWDIILDGKYWRGEVINRRKSGDLYHEELSIAPVKNKLGTITHFIGIKEDISDRKHLEQQLQKLANTDPLTELYNRRVFLEHLAQEAAKLDISSSLCSALLMIDLDHFKRINDTYGHSTGDEVLKKFSDIVRQTCRNTDIPARLGGEEFAILLKGTDQNDAMAVAERLRQQIADTIIPHEKGLVHITISIGAAALFANDVESNEVLKYADAALYTAKEQGRNQSCWFNPIDNTTYCISDSHE